MRAIQPVVTVSSVHKSIEWYGRVFGLKASFRNERPGEPESVNYAVLRDEDASLHLGLDRDMKNDAGQGAWNLVTDDFEQVLQNCRNVQATFYIEMTTIPTGQRSFGIMDPDGNLITVVEAEEPLT